MDFSFFPSDERIYADALRWAAENVNPLLGQERRDFNRNAWDALAEFGLMGLCVPAEHGGKGWNALTSARVNEAFGRACPDRGLLFAAAAHLYAVAMPIAEFGNRSLKQKYLPQLASGKLIGANAISEEGAGSDVFALKTDAVRDGEHFVINGRKSFVTNAPVSDLILAFGITDKSSGYFGLSAFLVERNSNGIKLGEIYEKTGLHSAKASWLSFENCRIPETNLVGDEGSGTQVFGASMKWERACLFGIFTGMMERQLELTIKHLKKRKQFGKPLSRNQVIAHRIANMKLRLDSARLFLYRACTELDAGREATLEISSAKLAISEAAIENSREAMQLHGGEGVLQPGEIEAMLKDSLASTIFSGTSEIQRDLIARELGLL